MHSDSWLGLNHIMYYLWSYEWASKFSLTFLMVRHLDDSVKPTMSSGEHTLTNGKSDIFASCAARAVFPEFGGP